MMESPYTFLIVRYQPDPGAGELLNVGVILFASNERFLGFEFEKRYDRLSHAFKGFEGQPYRTAVRRLHAALQQLRKTLQQKALPLEGKATAYDLLQMVAPDLGLSLYASEPLGGITDDPSQELAILFDRMVSSRYERGRDKPRRTDDQVWKGVFAPRLERSIVLSLREKTFETNEVEHKFEHAFKNGAWHVVQPVSMDYVTSESIQRKATQWVGTTVGLEGVKDLAKIYFLLGKPLGHHEAYEKAKRLLDKAPVPHEIVEEDAAEDFARELGALVHSHDDSDH